MHVLCDAAYFIILKLNVLNKEDKNKQIYRRAKPLNITANRANRRILKVILYFHVHARTLHSEQAEVILLIICPANRVLLAS